MATSSSTGTSSEGPFTCFFYGTLIHPGVLSRIIGAPGSHLEVQQAILPHHSAHRVKNAEYPGLLATLGMDASDVVRVARGVLVRGLTSRDVQRLDAFEGEEYARVKVECITVGEAVANDQRSHGKAEELLNLLMEQQVKEMLQFQLHANVSESKDQQRKLQVQQAQTYIWIAPRSRLQHAEELQAEDQAWRWDFENFAKLHSHRWVSGERN